MSKETLAVKYRPRVFTDVTEQSAVVEILKDQIDTKTFKQAYLFCGPAGTGKTTSARIFANEINKGQGNPIEIDGASNNGVDAMREVIENSRRKPLDCDYKVFIVDEAHMISNAGWNALLKLLEEPPKTAVFIFATTDPQKIPATILSRVQRYDLSKISLQGIVNRLQYIIAQENAENNAISVNDEALMYISKLAEGGMRDAITMLDKCLSLNSKLTLEDVVKALGTVDYNTYFDLLFFLSSNGKQSAIKIIDDVYNSGKDLKQFLKQFQYFLVDVCKFKLFDNFTYINIPELPEYKQKLEDEDFELDCRVLDWATKVNSEIKWENNARGIINSYIILFDPSSFDASLDYVK